MHLPKKKFTDFGIFLVWEELMLLIFSVTDCIICSVVQVLTFFSSGFLMFEYLFLLSWYVAAVRQEISDETDRETGRSSKVISTVPIHLSIFSPNGKRSYCTSYICIKKITKYALGVLRSCTQGFNIRSNLKFMFSTIFPICLPVFI